jgi:hypothetical protein
MHMSKIFSFLSADTYSSLGVNFFRFPLRFPGSGKEQDPREPKAEQPRPLEVILKEAETVVRVFYSYADPNSHLSLKRLIRLRLRKHRNANLQSSLQNVLLDDIQRLYDELKSYEEDERTKETRKKLRAILENNGRNPEK